MIPDGCVSTFEMARQLGWSRQGIGHVIRQHGWTTYKGPRGHLRLPVETQEKIRRYCAEREGKSKRDTAQRQPERVIKARMAYLRADDFARECLVAFIRHTEMEMQRRKGERVS